MRAGIRPGAKLAEFGHNGGMGRFEYREFAPRAELAPFVRTIWRIDATEVRGEPRIVEPVLPDGCVEWILHFGDPFAIRREDGVLERQSSHLIAGPSTRSTFLERGDESQVLGIRFAPGAASALGLPPLESLVDHVVDVAALDMPRLERARDAIEAAPDSERIARLERGLLETFDTRRGRENSFLAPRLGTQTRVSDLAKDLGVSTRTLERRFARDVGFPPATLRAIERFRDALDLIDTRPGERLVDIALRAGYSDEPHLCREFRRFAGITPATYRRQRAELTRAFATGESPAR